MDTTAAMNGLKLRQIREGLGMSRGEAARLSGIREDSIRRLENSDVINPTMDTLVALSKAYGLTPLELAAAVLGQELRLDGPVMRVAVGLPDLPPEDAEAVASMVDTLRKARGK